MSANRTSTSKADCPDTTTLRTFRVEVLARLLMFDSDRHVVHNWPKAAGPKRNRFMKSLVTISLLLTMSSCAPAIKESLIAEGEIFQVETAALEITMKSAGSKVYCVPVDQFSDRYGEIRVKLRNGSEAQRKSYVNKQLYMIGGIDLAGGVYLVGSRKMQIYPPLENYSLDNSEIDKIEMQLSYFDCDKIDQNIIQLEKLDLTFNHKL